MDRMKARNVIFSLVAGCFAVLCVAGCDCPKERQTLLEENQLLTQQVAELEAQLWQVQAQASAPAAAAATTQPPATTYYLVVAGDSLWSIARDQLGSGTRYKEILALNPTLTNDKPLKIGTQLKLPPR